MERASEHAFMNEQSQTDVDICIRWRAHSRIRSLKEKRAFAIIFLFVVYADHATRYRFSHSCQIFISLLYDYCSILLRCMTFRLLFSVFFVNCTLVKASQIYTHARARRQSPFKRDKCEIVWRNLSVGYIGFIENISFIRSFFIFSSVWLCVRWKSE